MVGPGSDRFSVHTAHPADLFIHLAHKYASNGDVGYSAESLAALTSEFYGYLEDRYDHDDITDAAYVSCGVILKYLAQQSPDDPLRDINFERRVALMCALLSRNLAPQATHHALEVASAE